MDLSTVGSEEYRKLESVELMRVLSAKACAPRRLGARTLRTALGSNEPVRRHRDQSV
jgi:hypothetical protein